MKNLQAHYEDFLQESRDSALFSVADRLRLEEEVEACKTHFQHLMKSMENGVCLGKRERKGGMRALKGAARPFIQTRKYCQHLFTTCIARKLEIAINS